MYTCILRFYALPMYKPSVVQIMHELYAWLQTTDKCSYRKGKSNIFRAGQRSDKNGILK